MSNRPDGGGSPLALVSPAKRSASPALVSVGRASLARSTQPRGSLLRDINELGPQLMAEVEGSAQHFRYVTALETLGLVVQSLMRTMFGLNAPVPVPPKLVGRTYPSYYLRRYHGQPVGYLCPVASATFDRTLHYMFGRHLRTLRDQTAAALGEIGDGRIVDLGTGTGALLPVLRKTFAQAPLVGIDLSPYMLGVARRTVHGLEGVTLVEGDARELPLGEGSARGVTASFVFHEMPLDVVEASMREAFRVLAPGGRLVILDAVLEQRRSARLMHWLQTLFSPEPYGRAYGRAPVGEILQNVGFEHVETRYLVRGVGLRVWQRPA